MYGLTENAPTARTAQRFVRGERDDIGVRHRIGIHATGDETREVRCVVEEIRAHFVGDDLERLRIDTTRIARGAGDDEARTMFVREVAHLLHVDALVTRLHLVRNEVVEHAARVDRRAVREVSAVIEAEAEHRVALLDERLVRAHVGVGARVRLHVRVLGTEELLHAFDRDGLDGVDDLVAAVIALARVSLGVLVGEHAAGGAHDRRRGEVLAGDQLQASGLARELVGDEPFDFEIGIVVGGKGHGVLLLRTRFRVRSTVPLGERVDRLRTVWRGRL